MEVITPTMDIIPDGDWWDWKNYILAFIIGAFFGALIVAPFIYTQTGREIVVLTGQKVGEKIKERLE